MAPLRIEVNGESTIHRPAERAIVTISVQSEGPSQDEVARNVTTTSKEIRNILSGFNGKDEQGRALPDAPITHWFNSNLSTGSFFRYGQEGDQKERIHTASMSFKARFRDFARLGSVATTLATMEHVSIQDVEWRLTDETTASYASKCRYQAVQDAVAKAKDYAEALGRPMPAVTEVRDSYGGGGPGRNVTRMMVEGAAMPGSIQDNLNFEPEDVSLTSNVQVTLEEKV